MSEIRKSETRWLMPGRASRRGRGKFLPKFICDRISLPLFHSNETNATFSSGAPWLLFHPRSRPGLVVSPQMTFASAPAVAAAVQLGIRLVAAAHAEHAHADTDRLDLERDRRLHRIHDIRSWHLLGSPYSVYASCIRGNLSSAPRRIHHKQKRVILTC
jgi:hypothetical protein